MELSSFGINKLRQRIYGRLVISLIVLLLLLSLSDIVTGVVYDAYKKLEGRIEINLANGSSSESGEAITPAGVKVLAEAFPDVDLTYISEESSLIKNGFMFIPVNVVYTGSVYDRFSKIKIIKGSYFNEASCKNGSKVAVISTTLAGKLFSTYNAIGNYIRIQDEKYKVTGIYEEDSSIVSFLTADGGEKVYVPFESAPRSALKQVKTIILDGKVLKDDKFRVHKVEQVLEEQLSVFPSDKYKVNDYYTNSLVEQIKPLFIFIVGLWSILLLAWYFTRYARHRWLTFKSSLIHSYLLDGFKSQWLLLIQFIIVSLGFAACIAGIFMLVKFDLYFPRDLIPQDNIFDIHFYCEKIKESIREFNSAYHYVPTIFERDYGVLQIIILVLSLSVIPVFVSAVGYVKLLKLTFTDIFQLGRVLLQDIGFKIFTCILAMIVIILAFSKPEALVFILFTVLYLGKGKIYMGTKNENDVLKSM